MDASSNPNVASPATAGPYPTSSRAGNRNERAGFRDRRGRLPEVPAGGRPYARTVGRFLVRRLLFTVFVLFVVSLITFVIFVKLPASDPARRATGKATTEANIEAAREAFGLNRPSTCSTRGSRRASYRGRGCS